MCNHVLSSASFPVIFDDGHCPFVVGPQAFQLCLSDGPCLSADGAAALIWPRCCRPKFISQPSSIGGQTLKRMPATNNGVELPVLSLVLLLIRTGPLPEQSFSNINNSSSLDISNRQWSTDGQTTRNLSSAEIGGGNATSRGWLEEADDEIMSILIALDSDLEETNNGTTPPMGIQQQTWSEQNNNSVSTSVPTVADDQFAKEEEEKEEKEEEENAIIDLRLPDHLKPIRYELRLTLDSETDLVQGQVQVELQCVRPTALVQLHVAPDFLQIGHVLLESRLHFNRSLHFRSVSTEWRAQQLRLQMAEPLERGHVYYLSIWFNAHYATHARGLDRRVDKRRGLWMNTLFEPAYARRLFPCWDEPRFRASFRLELWLLNRLAADDYVALSGTDGQCQRWHANLSICQFAPTPPIPTYIFSLAVGRFQSVCSDDHDNNFDDLALALESNICIWRLADLRPEEDKQEKEAEEESEEEEEEWKHRARLTIQKMAHFQASMLDYLLVHPGARLHLLIVPLRMGGMENFGLLNVREFLWPLPNETEQEVQRFEKTLFHEMTHQWFGNLVTPEWWDAIWLAESLTTFMSTPRPIVFDPSWDLSETAVAMSDGKWALDEGQHVQIPGVVYTKGAALLEMLDALIGPDRMRRLLRDFVRLFQFKAAKTADFLHILERVVAADAAGNDTDGQQVSTSLTNASAAVHFLDRWLHLPSHPIVFVDFDPELGQLCFSQTPKMAKQLASRWPIPIWVECLEASVQGGEQLLWVPDSGEAQLLIPLSALTKTNSTRALAFNRNRPVYYQLSIRWDNNDV